MRTTLLRGRARTARVMAWTLRMARNPNSLILRTARWLDPQIRRGRTRQYDQGQDVDTEIERGQGCTGQTAEISQT